MNNYERKKLDDFFTAIKPNLAGYREANFSYVAFKKGDAFDLAQGRLQLSGVPATVPSRSFQSESVKAGIFRLSEVSLSAQEFVDGLLQGKAKTPEGDLLFFAEKDRSHSLYFASHHSEGISNQRRQIHLSITGDHRLRPDGVLVDWELKAAPTPFFNLQELCDEFFVGPLRGDYANVDVIAFNVAVIATESSIEGTKAKLVLVLADGLETDKSAIGYRVFERNRVIKRGLLRGSELSWGKFEKIQRGVGEIEVPAGAVIDCVANFAGVAQNHFWVEDPKTAQNPFRAIHHAFDNNLDVLRELVTKAHVRGAHARDLELAVSWLLWMLGFNTTHIGGTSKTSDAPDLIAATPSGNLMVIECTTGILKEDSKLPHLFQRAEKVRQSLAACGNAHLRVLPIIVTTKTADEIEPEVEQAHKLGVLVATIEDFEDMLNRTRLFPDPNGLYLQLEETLRRYQTPSPLDPGNLT